jgi:hypothetical protein
MDGIIPMRTRMKMLDSVDDDYFGPRKNIMTLIVLTKQSFVSEPSWYRRKGLKQKPASVWKANFAHLRNDIRAPKIVCFEDIRDSHHC